MNPLTGNKEKQFELKPFVQLNERMGNVAEPATKHFFDKDIYTHITYAEIEKAKSDHGEEGHNHEENEDYQPYKNKCSLLVIHLLPATVLSFFGV